MTPAEIAAEVRAALADMPAIHEVRMFGGIGFMLNGNMLVATSKQGLLARVGEAAQAQALSRPGAELMEMRSRPMRGYVVVAPDALVPADIADWVSLARVFVATLPPKDKSARRKGTRK
jgi:TfoX/Sxy family transcriptional regulator of competence genes